MTPRRPGHPDTAGLSTTDDTAVSNDISTRLGAVEKAIADLRKKPKDRWDILQVLSTALVPIAIAIVGTTFSISTSRSEISVATTNAKVAQAELVHSFMEALTSGDPQERKLAVGAVMLALPEDGESLIRTVKESDPDAGVRAFASEKLGNSDLYAQLTLEFDNYEGASIPQGQLFSEGGELSIGIVDEAANSLEWRPRLDPKDFDTILSSSIQITNRHTSATTEGVMVTQTHTFERFSGDLGDYSNEGTWSEATVAAVFRINEASRPRTDVARTPALGMGPFEDFYGIDSTIIELWSMSDYAVTPLFPIELDIYLGSSTVASLQGIIAHVREHDEDVRNLHIAFFAPRM